LNQFLEHSFDRNLRVALESSCSKVTFGSNYNFKCPYCGDSKKNKNKKRAYILKNKIPWGFYCHNCGTAKTAENFLKEKYPMYYRYYISELMLSKEELPSSKTKEDSLKKDDSKDKNGFVKITDGEGELFKRAIEYCINRKIEHDIWKNFFVSVDGFYKDRLIIPFYNKDGDMVYWVGRSLNDDEQLKYLNRVQNKDEAIYNLHKVDTTKCVVVLEGVIDSFFVENSICILGTYIKKEVAERIAHLDKRYLYDNDKTGKKHSIMRLKNSEYVFNWTLFLKGLGVTESIKDINDLYIKGFLKKKLMYKDIDRYFTNNIYDKAFFI
jgi:hypothetical protein